MNDLLHPQCHEAAAYLRTIDEDWASLVEIVGPCRFGRRPYGEPYQALMHAIAYQQIAVKAGDAIFGRFLALYPEDDFPSPAQVFETDFDTLRGCGFSGRKIETLKGIAEATASGVVPTAANAADLADHELIERLVTIKGIGRWTVEMMLMFTLERHDVLPADDFGVREGYRLLKSLEAQPTPKALRVLGEAWAPYRTIASWYLWRVPRKRAGIMT
jgi:DNA-3-methyladenine glycosylase II